MLHHRPPSRQFLLERATGVRRLVDGNRVQGRSKPASAGSTPSRAALGGGAVEIDVVNVRTAGEQAGEIVGDHRALVDGGIQAAGAYAGLQRIPQRNATRHQGPRPLDVRHCGIKTEQGGHDRPEGITRMA